MAPVDGPPLRPLEPVSMTADVAKGPRQVRLNSRTQKWGESPRQPGASIFHGPKTGELPMLWSDAHGTGRQPAAKAAPKDGGRPGAKGGMASTIGRGPGVLQPRAPRSGGSADSLSLHPAGLRPTKPSGMHSVALRPQARGDVKSSDRKCRQ